MEFNKITEKGMEKVVSRFAEETVIFQMEDTHACYFDGANGANEYKLIIDQDELVLEKREQGKEDWHTWSDIDLIGVAFDLTL